MYYSVIPPQVPGPSYRLHLAQFSRSQHLFARDTLHTTEHSRPVRPQDTRRCWCYRRVLDIDAAWHGAYPDGCSSKSMAVRDIPLSGSSSGAGEKSSPARHQLPIQSETLARPLLAGGILARGATRPTLLYECASSSLAIEVGTVPGWPSASSAGWSYARFERTS
jgi:hypothetical protein